MHRFSRSRSLLLARLAGVLNRPTPRGMDGRDGVVGAEVRVDVVDPAWRMTKSTTQFLSLVTPPLPFSSASGREKQDVSPTRSSTRGSRLSKSAGRTKQAFGVSLAASQTRKKATKVSDCARAHTTLARFALPGQNPTQLFSAFPSRILACPATHVLTGQVKLLSAAPRATAPPPPPPPPPYQLYGSLLATASS